jgi:two-component system CheB/CheR fusion protein
MARFDLHAPLRKAIKQAMSDRQPVTDTVEYQEEGTTVVVKLNVVPLQDPESKTPCFLVLFQRTAQPNEPKIVAPTPVVVPGGDIGTLARRIHELERELSTTKEQLQTTILEKESTLEELKGANEELQSSNEELRSTNEELETSREEMQSTNEELTTLNDELHNRMTELSLVNDDLHNVLSGVDNAVVIAGMDLKIRRFTSAAEKLFHLGPADIGRTISFLDTFLGVVSMERKATSVIQNLVTVEEEVLAANNRWYALKISPFKTMDHSIRGALVTLVDIDVRKRAQEMTRDVGAYAGKFLGAIAHPLLIVDSKLRVVWANDAFLSIFQLAAEETVGTTLTSLGTTLFSDPGLRAQIDRVFASATIFRNYEIVLRTPDRAEITVRVGGSQVPASAESLLALLSIELTSAAPKRLET